jgi:hypothetical protein
MTKNTIAFGVLATALVLVIAVAFLARQRSVVPPVAPDPGPAALEPHADPAAAATPRSAPATSVAEEANDANDGQRSQGFLYGRITAKGGAVYEGRLRWGSGEEAFWSEYFNGAKDENVWAAQVPEEELPKKRVPVALFGLQIAHRERPIDLGRLFMARFGDIARIDAHGAEVRVTLRSGSVVVLDRLEAGDFDDGVRVWDAKRGVVDLDSLQIRTIEMLPTPVLGAVPARLHGTVRTPHGDFTGFLQWNRVKGVGSDGLDGRSADGAISVRFDTIRSIARRPPGSALVTLRDGRELVLSGEPEVGAGNRGVYVDDRRYGRVLVSWDAVERVDFAPDGSGPAYDDFAPGRALLGAVVTRAGERLAGRLVFDLDESETTETLDAPSQGVDYTLPFGHVAAIVPAGRDEGGDPRARVILHDGEELRLERAGDLGDGNAGMLIFVDGRPRPEYVLWSDVARVDLERPPAPEPPPAREGP